MLLVLNRSENRYSFRSNVFRSATAIRRSLSKSYHVPEGIAYRVPVPVPVPCTASIRNPGNPGSAFMKIHQKMPSEENILDP